MSRVLFQLRTTIEIGQKQKRKNLGVEKTWRIAKAARTQGLRSQIEGNHREMRSTFCSVDFGSLLILGKQKLEFRAYQGGGGPGKCFSFQSRTLKGYVPERDTKS